MAVTEIYKLYISVMAVEKQINNNKVNFADSVP